MERRTPTHKGSAFLFALSLPQASTVRLEAFLRSFSSRKILRIRRLFGVTSRYSSSVMYSMHSSKLNFTAGAMFSLLSVPLGDPGTDAALLALAVGCALLTAGNRLGPRWVLAALAGAVGLAVGLGSGDPAFTPQQRWVTMGGSLVGALVIAGHTGFWTEALTALRRLTHAVTAVRIGAAWLAAITLMLLGLTLRG